MHAWLTETESVCYMPRCGYLVYSNNIIISDHTGIPMQPDTHTTGMPGVELLSLVCANQHNTYATS